MRHDVEKYLIFGPWSQRDLFFEEAQRLGIAEFISSRSEALERPLEVQTFVEALHILRAMPPVKQVAPYDYHSAIVFARHIVDQKERLERMREKMRILDKEIARIEIFGDFSIPELKATEEMTKRHIQFFFAKKIEGVEATFRPEVIYVGSASGIHYFIAINKEKTSYNGLFEMKIERSLGDLLDEYAFLRRRVEVFEDELAQLAHHKKELRQGLAAALNHYHLEQSKERANAHLEGGIFAVEAWIPKNKRHILETLASETSVSFEPILVEEKDKIPTYLENQSIGILGQDLVSIYDTPSRSDRDPSWWVFFSFALFFSMIIADVGYGIILLGIALYLYWKYGKKEGLGRRIIKLTIYLSIGCIIWGMMIPSFLGIDFPPDSKWRSISLVTWMVKKKAAYSMEHKDKSYQEIAPEYPQLQDAKNPMEFFSITKVQDHRTTYPVFEAFQDSVLIEIVIFLGAIHLMLSFLRYVDKNWAAIGWVIFMIGAYLYFPSIIKTVSILNYIFGVPEVLGAKVGFLLIWVGLGLASVLAVIQKRLGGLGEIMHVIQIFADTMSYLRIYALSLAGMIMASTFNHIGSRAPFYVGFLIIFAGHTVNFVLAIMGGIIHGLRLNFIEWYHYSFEGGGRNFKPLSLHRIE